MGPWRCQTTEISLHQTFAKWHRIFGKGFWCFGFLPRLAGVSTTPTGLLRSLFVFQGLASHFITPRMQFDGSVVFLVVNETIPDIP